MKKIKVGIVGATGFTAGELIRILLHHPQTKIVFLTSTSLHGTPVSEVHTDLVGESDLKFQENADVADVVFLCLPHGESKNWLTENAQKIGEKAKIIDLGNDFRVNDLWQNKKFIYGLSEFNKTQIASADCVANPGCFATAIQLGVLPILMEQTAAEIHCVGITGATGAGKALQQSTNFSWRSNNVSPYKTFTHQHLAEINKTIHQVTQQKTEIRFVPWRGDFTRGIFVTLMMQTQHSLATIFQAYERVYEHSPFVFLSEKAIDLKQVVNTNKALIHIEKSEENLAVHVAIDNLLKGASGQAVQNMNLMFGFDEKAGLNLKASVF